MQRQKTSNFILILIITLLVGCGGGGSNSSEDTSQSEIVSTEPHVPILTNLFSYDTSGQARSVIKDGKYIYLADGVAGLQIYKFNSDNYIAKIASVNMQDESRAYSLVKDENYIYLAARTGGIYVIDVSVPSEPLLLYTISTPGDASFLELSGSSLLVSTNTHFLTIDISNPLNGHIIGQIATPSPNQHISLKDDFAFVAAYNNGLRILDITEVTNPTVLKEFDLGIRAIAISNVGKYVFVGGEFGEVIAVDISNTNNPAVISSVNTINSEDLLQDNIHPLDFLIWGDFIFIADGLYGIHIVNIKNPTNLILKNTINLDGNCFDLFLDGRTIICANYDEGLTFLDLFDTADDDNDQVANGEDSFPNNSSEWEDTDKDGVGNNADNDDDNDGVKDADDFFPENASEWLDSDNDGVGDNSDIFPYDVSEWEDSDFDGLGNNADDQTKLIITEVVGYSSFGQARGTLRIDNIVYVANGTSGLTVLEISLNGLFSELFTYPLSNGGRARSLQVIDHYLYMASRSEGVKVFDITDKFTPVLINTYDTPDMATFLTIAGNRLYLSDRKSLLILDISTPGEPFLLGQLNASTEFEHVVVSNDIAFIAAYYSGLVIADVSDPSHPVIIKTFNVGSALWAIEKKDNLIFTGGEQSGLLIIDIQELQNPEIINTIALPDVSKPKPEDQPPFHMQIKGSYLFIADGYSGVQILDISDPSVPILTSSVSTNGYTTDFSLKDNTLIVGNHSDGLQHFTIGGDLDVDNDSYPNHIDHFPLDPHRN